MREFIKLIESEWTDEERVSSDEDARFDRETKIEALIRHVFGKLGLDIASRNHSINYDDSDRECTIYLEGPVPLTSLAKLETMGLGSGFKIGCSGDFVMLEFIVAEGIEHATPE